MCASHRFGASANVGRTIAGVCFERPARRIPKRRLSRSRGGDLERVVQSSARGPVKRQIQLIEGEQVVIVGRRKRVARGDPVRVRVFTGAAGRSRPTKGAIEKDQRFIEAFGDTDEIKRLDRFPREVTRGEVLHPVQLREGAETQFLLVQAPAAVVAQIRAAQTVIVIRDDAINRMPDPSHVAGPGNDGVEGVAEKMAVNASGTLGNQLRSEIRGSKDRGVVQPKP